MFAEKNGYGLIFKKNRFVLTIGHYLSKGIGQVCILQQHEQQIDQCKQCKIHMICLQWEWNCKFISLIQVSRKWKQQNKCIFTTTIKTMS